MSVSSRDHSLDAARGILMGLGVLLHASNIYAPAGGWIVEDPETHPFFAYLGQTLHVFRMPVFFWISGYFCCMGFFKLGSQALLRVRMPRLLLPLLTTLFTLNVLQDLWVGWSKGTSAMEALQAGLHLHHLWFLVYLLIFFALAGLVLPVARTKLVELKETRAPGWVTIVVALTVASYTLEMAVRLTGFAYQSLWGLATPFGLTSYLPFFATGALMYAWRPGKAVFVSAAPWLIIPALAATIGLAEFTLSAKGWQAEVLRLAHWLGAWTSVGLVLGLFERLFRTDTAFTRLVSDSAYTVYLFHHVVVVVIGMSLLAAPIPISLKFVLVCCAAWGLGLGVHLLVIRRVPLLQWLFNGKSSKPQQS